MGRKKRTRVFEEDGIKTETDIGSQNGEKSLYEILGVENTATRQEIKKAYHKLALRLHPDKNPGDEEAKENFQRLQKVIAILGDEEKRALYDQTGCVDDSDLSGESFNNLKEFFRSIYKTMQVTTADIEDFEANYRGSDSEEKDLKDLYIEFKGNMDRLFCTMICSDPKLDSHRFMDIINNAIAEGELKGFKAYKKWANVVAKSKPPLNPLARKKSRSKKKVETDLVAVISQRHNQRKEKFETMFDKIICNSVGEASCEPTEDEFQRARQRLEKKKLK
ncbi:Chaperone protein dnaJ 6 [Zostera marina]|uniref:Chaperone protein dnaJ 6 n=1 Tax=Zostera marina TaxID=29655 RepID=A0A0K9PW52_ZOSMR|nr:Chaperone protein dnaJ 6 [Zostera marina]